jgi:two-component system phosphate regulon sensor histidine kinase PhoR
LRYAGIIHDQASRLNDQVERVLQIAGLQKGKILLRKEEVSLKLVIDEMIEQLKSRVESEGASISANYTGQNFMIMADQHHLSNILYNLVDNALKYSRGGAKVIIDVVENTQFVQLSVCDQGIGIAKMYLAKLDQKFFRVPTGNIHNNKGFGLGLHYVRQMVKMHGWQMTITSTPGEGTQVTLIIKKQSSHGA